VGQIIVRDDDEENNSLIDPKGIAPKFPKNSKGLIPVENRWELAEQIGHGVDCWQVSPLSMGPNGKQSTPPAVYLLYGCFEKFIFPSSIDSVFVHSKDIHNWREKRNTAPKLKIGKMGK
jgi:hypothetical protein